jgi:hypothetical protein|tara:strand:- start:160 stop:342 length:183 start_codon:yes stop_codon:yes gene_type:complete
MLVVAVAVEQFKVLLMVMVEMAAVVEAELEVALEFQEVQIQAVVVAADTMVTRLEVVVQV